MLHKYLPILLLAQCLLVQGAPTEKPAAELERERVEQEAKAETVALLDTFFQAQIEYFTKVKAKLGADTQRARDIAAYMGRLNEVIATKDIDQKDQLWMNTFQDFSKSPLLLNKQAETGLSNSEYEAVLKDSGLQEITKSFMADVAVYFWKMAKTSGKVVEMAIDDYISSKREVLLNLINRIH